MAAKINEKAWQIVKEGLDGELEAKDTEILTIVFAEGIARLAVERYLEACEEIKTEEEIERKRKEKEGLDRMMADAGWFPGDCCD